MQEVREGDRGAEIADRGMGGQIRGRTEKAKKKGERETERRGEEER